MKAESGIRMAGFWAGRVCSELRRSRSVELGWRGPGGKMPPSPASGTLATTSAGEDACRYGCLRVNGRPGKEMINESE